LWWLILFLDNGDEFLMTWEFNSLIQLEKIVGWNIRFDCYVYDMLIWRCVWKLKWNIENGCYRGNIIILERKMMFEFTNNCINQWVNWFIGDTLAARPLTQARVMTSNKTSRCLTPIKLLN
jgi:hypothetical protein